MIYNFKTLAINLLVTTNAIGNAGLFLAMTPELSLKQQRRIARQMGMSLIIIFLITLWCGQSLLDMMGISIPAFETAGGLIVLLIGLSMLHGGNASTTAHTEQDRQDAHQQEAIAVVPLSIPLVAGPGALTVLLIQANHIHTAFAKPIISLICVGVALVVTTVFSLAPYLVRFLGQNGLRVITRIMGLLLASMAFQMMAHGLKALGLFGT